MSERRQMFYMLANIHHQITTNEMLPSPDRFWYYLLVLPFGIQNMVTSFLMELEHLISHETLQSLILYSAVGTNVPSLHAFCLSLSRGRA
jgi:hypothetical protein